MAYDYQSERSVVFSEGGQVMFLKIRDEAFRLTDLSGVVQMGKLLVGSGDTWAMMACVDRLVEIGDLFEIKYGDCAGQHRVFRRPYP